MNGQMTGTGPTGGGGGKVGADGGASGIIVVDLPSLFPPGVGLGMNTGNGLLMVRLRFLRNVCSLARKVGSFKIR